MPSKQVEDVYDAGGFDGGPLGRPGRRSRGPYGNLPLGTVTPDHLTLLRQLADLQQAEIIGAVLSDEAMQALRAGASVPDLLFTHEEGPF